MITRGYIDSTLRALDAVYTTAPPPDDAQRYAKLAIIELCGWIEESMDGVILTCSKRHLKHAPNQTYCESTIIKKTYGFDYDAHFRFMLIRLAGLVNVEKLEQQVNQAKHIQMTAALANRPALAFAYHMPPRNSPEYYAMGLLDQMLVQGDDSLLYRELVKKRGYTGSLTGGINSDLGDMFDYSGPMLWSASLIYDPNVKPDQILSAADSVIESLRAKLVDRASLERSVTKLRSSLYDSMTQFGGFGRANLLACFALFDDNPGRINSLEAEFRKVTPELIEKTAREYFRKTNRTVLEIEPGAKSGGGPAEAQP